jgi:hypothetical protein
MREKGDDPVEIRLRLGFADLSLPAPTLT